MTYYDGAAWQTPGRQASWEQPPPPSRSGASSAMSREDSGAFSSQFEEVERALDNLNKSGKLFMPGRRDSLPMGPPGRPYAEFDPRMSMPPRHHSMDFDPSRPHSASNVQGYYQNQRYQPRHNDADQMQQAKRRMAAQRERELRNYHQEQQYNRSVMADVSTQGKPERANSPSAMNEEERRDLIARQHRALYGNEGYYEGSGFSEDGHTPRPGSQATGPLSARGHSPMAFNNFGGQDNQGVPDDAAKGPSPKPAGTRSRSNSNSSPASASNPQNFSLFDSSTNPQQTSRTSTSSPGTSPPRGSKTSAPAPIGTRPTNPALNKRNTPPASSPLSFGFATNDGGQHSERASSAASNPNQSGKENERGNLGWGSSSGVWGSKSGLGGVQASVWG